MSIKNFHIVFIVCSIVLVLGFGFWALHNDGHPVTPGLRITAASSFCVAMSLIVYCIQFIKKMKLQK